MKIYKDKVGYNIGDVVALIDVVKARRTLVINRQTNGISIHDIISFLNRTAYRYKRSAFPSITNCIYS